MKVLTKNTLLDISKHSNKTLKLIELMTQADYKLYYKQLAGVDSKTDSIVALEAFHKDLTTTVGILENAHQLLSTVDDDGDVIKLKSDEKNLIKLFGDHYNHDNRTITLNGINIPLKSDFDSEVFKEKLIKNTLGINLREYEVLYKERKKILSLQKNQLRTDDDKVKYISTSHSLEKYNKIMGNIYDIAGEFNDYRSSLTLEQKNTIDREITFERSMIDSVLSTSSYITKDNGIENISGSHNKNKGDIHIINDLIKNHNFIAAIEIDKDVDLDSVISLLKETINTNFNMSTNVTLKLRKLGNYNVRGMYIGSDNTIAIDVKSPNALVHEFIHAVELSSDDILLSKARNSMYLELRDLLDPKVLFDKYPEKYADYIMKDVEIIARGGEIAFLLNKFDYNPDEPFEVFYDKVKKHESLQQKDISSYNFVKNIDFYIYNSDIYFDIKNAPRETLANMKEFYQSYFNHDGRNIKPISTAKIPQKNYKVKIQEDDIVSSSRYVPKSVSLFNSENIIPSFSFNDENKIVDPAILLQQLIEQCTHVNRSTQKYDNTTYYSQAAVFKQLPEYIESSEQKERLQLEVFKHLYKVLKSFDKQTNNYSDTIVFRDMILNNLKLNLNTIYELKKDKINELESTSKEVSEQIQVFVNNKKGSKSDKYPIEYYELHTKLRQTNDDLLQLKRAVSNLSTVELKSQITELHNRYQDERDYRYYEVKGTSYNTYEKDKNGDIVRNEDGQAIKVKAKRFSMSTINNRGHSSILSGLIDLTKKVLNSDDLEKTLAYLNKDDHLSFALLTDPAIIELVEPENRETFIKKSTAILVANGFLDQLLDAKDSFIHSHQFNYQTKELNEKVINAENAIGIMPEAENLISGKKSVKDVVTYAGDYSEIVYNSHSYSDRISTSYEYKPKSKQEKNDFSEKLDESINKINSKSPKKATEKKKNKPNGDGHLQLNLF